MGRQLSWQSSGLLIRWSRVRSPHDPPRWMLSSVWLEHLPYKQRVIGSSPIASTIPIEPKGSFFNPSCCIYETAFTSRSQPYFSTPIAASSSKSKPNLNPNLKIKLTAQANFSHLPKQLPYLLLQHLQQHSISHICSGAFEGISNEVKINSDYEVSA